MKISDEGESVTCSLLPVGYGKKRGVTLNVSVLEIKLEVETRRVGSIGLEE